MTDLRTRLQILRQAKRTREVWKPEELHEMEPSEPEDSGFLEGWERAGEYTFRRVRTRPLDPQPGFLKDLQDGAAYLLSCPLERIYWFDAETTGLSGGAGTTIFLFGVAQVVSSQIVVRQFFLKDFPGEAEFLNLLRDSIPFQADSGFLSYNGSSFDAPLLKTRFILQRFDPPLIRQVDLLHLVRRLWKRSLPDCSLHTVERVLLARERELDLPGRMIPQVYFEYLRTGSIEGIRRVVQHHEDDLLSLVYLSALLGSLIREPGVRDGVDATALGLLLTTLNPSAGWAFLEQLAREGNPIAAERLSKKYRWEGKTEEGERIRAPFTKTFFPVALEELKHLEHWKKNYPEALELAQYWAKRDLPAIHRADLEHRMARLRRKLGSKNWKDRCQEAGI
ncbi:MAG: hypothetical protein Kow009_04380 [Spirochaetales bacterium]